MNTDTHTYNYSNTYLALFDRSIICTYYRPRLVRSPIVSVYRCTDQTPFHEADAPPIALKH